MSARYLTTTLPYVNADPHIGFALEIIQADALVRSWRAAGNDVFFTTGTDEHGQKILQAAEKAGQDVTAYVDHYANEFKKLKEALGISDDLHFIRTTDPMHITAAQEMWRRCAASGDIYKKSYTGTYCVGCEAYKTEKDLVDGKCPIHPSLTPEVISEENYFFRFSNYQEKLLAYLEQPGVIIPEWRRDEAIAFVEGGLEDFSISREKKRLSWGVPVPGDEEHVMYVWFDALTNYISTLGWPADPIGNFNKYWEEGKTLQMAGKDQVRFQSLMWQAMLCSAGIKNTDQVFYHGFINSGGQKMSKSLGNVISPYDLVKKYGTEATRYMLLRHIHPVEDSDVTWERLDEWYTANLVNGLGNVVARVMKMAEDNLDGSVNTTPSVVPSEYSELNWSEKFEFNRVMDVVWSHIQRLDGEITAQKPFELIKTNPTHGKELIAQLASEVGSIGNMLLPFMPATAEKILQAVKENKKPENLFPRLVA